MQSYWSNSGVWGVTDRVADWWGKIKDPVAPSLPPPWTTTRDVQPALVTPRGCTPKLGTGQYPVGERPEPAPGKGARITWTLGSNYCIEYNNQVTPT